jgi:hypothetical protein
VTPFQSVSVIRHPRPVVAALMRDRLSELVPLIEDIEAITTVEREALADGRVRVVNEWQARADVPAALAAVIRPEMLRWTDTALWSAGSGASAWSCSWSIVPAFQAGRFSCAGETRYGEAMAGRGTRVDFQGTLEVSARGLPGITGLLESQIGRAIESFAVNLIPASFRNVTRALGTFLDRSSGR